MNEIIKTELRKFNDANLASEGAVEHIAETLVNAIEAAREQEMRENPTAAIYTPEAIFMFKGILDELEKANQLEEVSELYEKIAATCAGHNNGVCLSALGEAVVALVTNAMEHTKNEMSQTPEVPSQETPAG